MLFFQSEDSVKSWCEARALPQGATISLEQLWQLAVTWYSNRLTVESRRPRPDVMVGIFEEIGLVGSFWDPSSDQWTSAMAGNLT